MSLSLTTLRRVLLLEKRCIKAASSPSSSKTTKLVRSSLQFSSDASTCDLVEFSPLSVADGDDKHFRVIPEFVDPAEEQSVLNEVSKAFKRKKYQYDHWDGVS